VPRTADSWPADEMPDKPRIVVKTLATIIAAQNFGDFNVTSACENIAHAGQPEFGSPLRPLNKLRNRAHQREQTECHDFAQKNPANHMDYFNSGQA